MKKIFLALLLLLVLNFQAKAVNVDTRLGKIFKWIAQNESAPMEEILSTELYSNFNPEEKDKVFLQEIINLNQVMFNLKHKFLYGYL